MEKDSLFTVSSVCLMLPKGQDIWRRTGQARNSFNKYHGILGDPEIFANFRSTKINFSGDGEYRSLNQICILIPNEYTFYGQPKGGGIYGSLQDIVN